MYIQIPVKTEVIAKNEDICTQGKFEDGKVVIEMDTRRRDYKKLWNVPRGECIRWINERTFEVQELSSFAWPIVYRIITADGYYQNNGERVYVTPAIEGLSTRKKVSDVVVRLAVFLSIIAGLGYRKASWLMEVLFRIVVSKSALERWVDEIAEHLPSADDIVKLLNQQNEITEGHLDELFPLGGKACVLVLKDEHGRIIVSEEVEKRDEDHVKPFLARLKRLGLKIKTFYLDHCQAYVNAIEAGYPEAEIQFDYFHILQNIWRHAWKELCGYRREVKVRGEASRTPWYSKKLKDLATRLWKNRYLFFKSDKHLTPEEKEKMIEVINTTNKVSFIRGFLEKVWSIFEEAKDEAEARKKLEELKKYSAQQDKESGFTKAINFLDTHFQNMITFLRVSGVQRNSLAESGMRVLRRLERSHDGFRSDKARQNALKIYQAVMYLGWSIHDPPDLSKISVS
jgi:hypothetical protein